MTSQDGVQQKMFEPQTFSSSCSTNGIDLSAPKKTLPDQHGSKVHNRLDDFPLKPEQISLEDHDSNHPGEQMDGHNNGRASELLRASPSTEMKKKSTNLTTKSSTEAR